MKTKRWLINEFKKHHITDKFVIGKDYFKLENMSDNALFELYLVAKHILIYRG